MDSSLDYCCESVISSRIIHFPSGLFPISTTLNWSLESNETLPPSLSLVSRCLEKQKETTQPLEGNGAPHTNKRTHFKQRR